MAGRLILVLMLSWSYVFAAVPSSGNVVRNETGIDRGMAVCLGCTDADFLRGLSGAGAIVVQAAHRDGDLTAIRNSLFLEGLSGAVSAVMVDSYDNLPYSSNLLNLVIADLDEVGSSEAVRNEINRILAPGGYSYLRVNGSWISARKSRAADTDDWRQFRHDPTMSAFSGDKVAGVAEVLQWDAGPMYQGVPLASGDGVLFNYRLTNNSRGKTERTITIQARDAFNGFLLWEITRDFDTRVYPTPAIGFWGGKDRGTQRTLRMLTVLDGKVFLALKPEPLVLDALTGEMITSLPVNDLAYQITYSSSKIIVVCRDGIHAFDRSDLTLSWSESCKPMDPVVLGEQLAFLDYSSTPYSLVCLNAADGKEKWSFELTTYLGKRTGDPQLANARIAGLMDGGIVVRNNDGMVFRVNMNDGSSSWNHDLSDSRTINSYSFIPGELWTSSGNTFTGIDLSNGTYSRSYELHEINPQCQWLATTPNLSLFKDNTWMDNATGEQVFFAKNWGDKDSSRISLGNTACGASVIPANGLMYFGNKECGCSLRGRSVRAGYPQRYEADPAITARGGEAVTSSGTVSAMEVISSKGTEADSWNSYLGSIERSAFAQENAGADMKLVWESTPAVSKEEEWIRDKFNGALVTAPTFGSEKVLVATPARHAVHALNADSGYVEWTFVAGGRIDGPPTIAHGLCVFGANDGWVYCLRMSDGAMAWKTRLGRSDRTIGSYGGFESAWPVPASVIVKGDFVASMAGRYHGYAGGVWSYGLDLKTGTVVWEFNEWLQNANMLVHAGDSRVFPPSTFTTRGWFGGGLSIKYRNIQTGRSEGRPDGYVMDSPDRSSLFDIYRIDELNPYLVSYDGTDAYCVNLKESETVVGVYNPGELVFEEKDAWKEWNRLSPKRTVSVGFPIRALATTPNQIVVAGNIGDGGRVLVLDKSNESIVSETDVPAPPVHEGLAVSEGNIYASLKNGTVAKIGNGEYIPVFAENRRLATTPLQIGNNWFSVPKAGEVNISVCDLRGRRVATLFAGRAGEGVNRFDIKPESIPSGYYLLRCISDEYKVEKPLLMTR